MRWTQTEQDALRVPGFQVWYKIDVLASSFLDGNSRVQDPHFMQEIQGLGVPGAASAPLRVESPCSRVDRESPLGAEAF